jgi:hypothetical protein
MALSVVLTQVVPGSAIVNAPSYYQVAVTNTGASAVTLQSLSVSEATESDVVISQPSILFPNAPIGLGNPVIGASSTVNYCFQVLSSSPQGPGPSPQNPGGAAPFPQAQTPDAVFTLLAMAQSSDGSIASGSLMVPVLTAIAPAPSIGGTLQFASGFSFVNLMMLGAL